MVGYDVGIDYCYYYVFILGYVLGGWCVDVVYGVVEMLLVLLVVLVVGY